MKPRILYVGNLRPGGNGLDRIAILRDQGHAVDGFDTFPYRAAGPRLLRSLTARWQVGPAVARFNRDVLQHAAQAPFDVLLVDKGTILRAETLLRLKAMARRNLAIHFTPDAAFVDNRSRQFEIAVPHYDLLVTSKPFETGAYRAAGAREVLLVHQGFGPRIDPDLAQDVPAALRSEVVFVGHCQPHYARMLRAAAAAAPLAVWGPGWPEYAARNAWAKAVVRGPGLYGPDYARALAGAKIALGLLSKRVPETTTTRSFEIPAMGALLLAERSGDHLALFAEDREAVYFGDAGELAAKLARCLADDAARTRIARAGQARALAEYPAARQFARITAWLEAALAARPGLKEPT
jgi:spore maturation protein CgeB